MANGMEGVPTIPVGSFTTDPMFQIYTKMGEIETKVSDSVFENYKLQVAQTNDINNRAMQTAFHTATQLDALKQAVNDANTQSMLAAERLKSAIQLSAAHTAEVVMAEGGATNAIIGSIDRENLNRELTDRATEVVALREGFHGWRRDFDALGGVVQAAGVSNQIAALGSQLQHVGQGFVNTGTATDTVQRSNPTNIA